MLFECHITVHRDDAEAAERIARLNHWKTSKIDGDPVLGNKPFFYLTTHETDYERILVYMRRTANDLRTSGVRVLRQKIELIMLDTAAA